jgi:hypothetical protein
MHKVYAVTHPDETVRPELIQEVKAFYLLGKPTINGAPRRTFGPFFGAKLDGDNLLLDRGAGDWFTFAHRCTGGDCWHLDGDPYGDAFFSFTMAAPEPKPARLTCLCCQHFNLQLATDDLSEVTPGDEFSISCLKGVWEYPMFDADEADYRRCMQTASTCILYSESD